MDYKLIMIDLDGTLLTDDRISICAENSEALKKAIEKGVKIVLASGRPKHSMNNFIKSENLNIEGGLCASFHGTIIYEADTLNNVKEITMDGHLVSEILGFEDKLINYR